MDWYSWLSKSNLDPALVFEYSLIFTHNELETGDIKHFNHEFLKSMGIAIAKHRLEILKLAKRDKIISLLPIVNLFTSLCKTKKRLTNYVHCMGQKDSAAIVVIPRPCYESKRWRAAAMLKRNKRIGLFETNRSMIKLGATGGTTPLVEEHNDKPGVEEEMTWVTMFQGLKPT
ncbi:sterile alpha motif (SAM) domain-containing protein [Carex rostrata]